MNLKFLTAALLLLCSMASQASAIKVLSYNVWYGDKYRKSQDDTINVKEARLPSGEYAYLFSVHLPPEPYQPYDLRDGKLKTEAQAIASAIMTRGTEIHRAPLELRPYLEAGKPVFLVGDFNEPSYLDWTERAALAGLHQMKVEWPATKEVANAGLKDAYREAYPHEVERPGYTWSPHPYVRTTSGIASIFSSSREPS